MTGLYSSPKQTHHKLTGSSHLLSDSNSKNRHLSRFLSHRRRTSQRVAGGEQLGILVLGSAFGGNSHHLPCWGRLRYLHHLLWRESIRYYHHRLPAQNLGCPLHAGGDQSNLGWMLSLLMRSKLRRAPGQLLFLHVQHQGLRPTATFLAGNSRRIAQDLRSKRISFCPMPSLAP